MQVYDVKVRFTRTVQVRQFEPAVGEVQLSAAVAEGEDHNEVIRTLTTDAKDGARSMILTQAAGVNASKTEMKEVESKTAADKAPAKAKVEKEAAPAKEEKPKRTRRTQAQIKADNKAAADKKAEEAKKAAEASNSGDPYPDDDIPGDDDVKGNISNDPENRVDPKADEVPGEEDDVPLEDLIGEGPTHETLNELISNAVGGTGKKKVAGGTIKEILGGYKAARVRDVASKDIQAVMDAIQAKIDG